MAFDFPNSPTAGQVFTPSGGPTYVYNAPAWELQTTSSSIAAAPFDALAYNGIQVNGGMEVSQDLGTTGRTTSGYVCDSWQLYFEGTMAVTSAQGNISIVPGFPNFIGVSVNTAQASLTGTQMVEIYTRIEGYRVARLAWGTAGAQPITIGFWCRHVRTGIYSVAVMNAAENRSYATTYTQNVSDTSEYKTVTIPGDTVGVWPTGNTSAIVVVFAMAGGPTITASTANTWLAGKYFAAPGQINGVAATSDIFRITGVTVLPGTQAPTAAQSPLIMRPHTQELLTCKRYWESSYDYGTLLGAVTGNGAFFITSPSIGVTLGMVFLFKVSKRALPTVNTYSPATGAAGKVRDAGSATDITIGGVFNTGLNLFCIYGTSVAANSNWQAHFVADARL